MEATAQLPATVFESQVNSEKLLLLLRAHYITNLPWIILTILLSLLPIVLGATGIFESLASEMGISPTAIDGFVLIWYLVVFAFAFQSFLSWYFNIYILTDRRIVDFDFFQLLYKKVSSAELGNIEDITVSMGGVAQAIFNYGDVNIQTAGTITHFEFLRVANPSKVKQAIEQAIHEAKK